MSKILQIIPAPAGLEALFEVRDREGIGIPVVCLALVEDSDKRREVRPMCADACGGIDFAEECSNYVGLSMG